MKSWKKIFVRSAGAVLPIFLICLPVSAGQFPSSGARVLLSAMTDGTGEGDGSGGGGQDTGSSSAGSSDSGSSTGVLSDLGFSDAGPGGSGTDSGGGDMPGDSGGGDMPGDMGGGNMPGDMGGDMGPGGDSGGSGGGAPSSEMPSNADMYFENEDNAVVEEGYEYISTDYGASAVAATGCASLTVGGDEEYYSAQDITDSVTDENTKATTEKYTEKYLGDGKVNSFIILGAEDGTGSSPGNGVTVDSGSAYITNTYIQTSGAASAAISGRYGIAALSSALVAVNDSFVIHTGATAATQNVEEPGSNDGLLISGRGRANFSVGSSTTMYFNSKVVTEGWAAMSTDSANNLHFYSYNSEAYAENGGYGVYADSGCNDFLYATSLYAAEEGAIISNNGVVEVYSGADAGDVTLSSGESLLSYNTGETSDEGSVVAGGRNSVMMHAPSSNGSDEAMNKFTLKVSNSALVTSESLKGESDSSGLSSARDYGEYYGEATGRWIDLVSGANLLVKSTYGTITLDNVTADSYSGVLLMTVPNSDSTSRYITAGNEGGDTELDISNSVIKGDICRYDFQRDLIVTLKDTDYSGAVRKMTADEWGEMWEDVADEADCYWGKLNSSSYNTQNHDVSVTLENSVWTVTDVTEIDSLTIDENSSLISADGGDVVMSVNGTECEIKEGVYEGDIVLTPSGVASVIGDGSSINSSSGASSGASGKSESASESASEDVASDESSGETAPAESGAASSASRVRTAAIVLMAAAAAAVIGAVCAVILYRKKKK